MDVYQFTLRWYRRYRETLLPNKIADQKKPTCVQDYNRFMGGVYNIDMVISTIECIRKSYKWYKKFVFYLLDASI